MSKRPLKLNIKKKYTRVEYLENTGWSRLYLDVHFNAGDIIEIESELRYTHPEQRQSELSVTTPWFFWGIDASSKWYAACKDYRSSSISVDDNWHVLRLVSLGEDVGFWLDNHRIITLPQYPAEVYAPAGLELWSYSNGQRNSQNMKKWLRVIINKKVVKNLIPVLDENKVPAMYDTVSKEFYYNSGDDELIAGPVL